MKRTLRKRLRLKFILLRISFLKWKYRKNRFGDLLALQGSGKDIWADEHADE